MGPFDSAERMAERAWSIAHSAERMAGSGKRKAESPWSKADELDSVFKYIPAPV